MFWSLLQSIRGYLEIQKDCNNIWAAGNNANFGGFIGIESGPDALYKMSCLLNSTLVKLLHTKRGHQNIIWKQQGLLKSSSLSIWTISGKQNRKFFLKQGRKTVIKEDWCLREKDLSEFDSQSQSGSQSLTSCVKLDRHTPGTTRVNDL